MIETKVVLGLILSHWAGDFLLQTNKMAINKSKHLGWLTVHVLVYSICFLWLGLTFAIANAAGHWLTDLVTSRLSGRAYKAGKIKLFWIIIGTDQMIHYATMVGLLWLLEG